MPNFLRRRLVCFYCGQKSNQAKTPSVRQWRCTACDADNYLDENGEITDPPASVTPDQTYKYATEPHYSSSPDLSPQQNTVFCKTCQKNQGILLQTLSKYLPDQSHPRYAEYEAKLPQFRTDLEKRYPPVCQNCVNTVNNRLQSTTYIANSENLKLQLERTRRRAPTAAPTWKGFFIALGAYAWWFAALAQLLWHAMGATLDESAASTGRLPFCLIRATSSRRFDFGCYESMSENMPLVLTLAFCSLWWNNRLSTSARGMGRLARLNDFYLLQLVYFALRVASYWAINNSPFTSRYPPRAIHTFVGMIGLIITLSSTRIVQIKRGPSLSDYKLNLVQAPETHHPTPATATPINDVFTSLTSPRRGFPVSALDTSSTSVSSQATHNTRGTRRGKNTASSINSLFAKNMLDDSDSDTEVPTEGSEMDWSPTTPSFNPRFPVRPLNGSKASPQPQPSPFKGKLPPAPGHPSHVAARPVPPPKPVFDRAPEQKRFEFQRGLAGMGWVKEEDPNRHDMPVGPARLQLPAQETGLENIFNSVFSLTDDPIDLIPDEAAAQAPNRIGGMAFWTLAIAVPTALMGCWMLGVQWHEVTF